MTGGGRGIGRAVVHHLSNLGYKVVFTYNNNKPLEMPDGVIGYRLDITDSTQCSRLLDELSDRNLFPEILINNAGVVNDSMFHKMTYEQFEEVINVNLVSLFNITQPVFIKMREKNFGRILNLSSINARKGQIGQVNYSASKAGVQGFTKALALEGARYGITVNSVSPGYIQTDMLSAMRDEIITGIISTVPVGRLGHVDEVARLCAFIISDDSGYITGANYDVNGGMYLA